MYIYYNYDGGYSALLAAAIHLGLVKESKDIKSLATNLIVHNKHFKRYKGNLFYIGCDSMGNRVYTMAVKRIPKVVERSVLAFSNIYQLESTPVMIDVRKFDIPFYPYFYFTTNITFIEKIVDKIYLSTLSKKFERLVQKIENVKNTGV